MSRLIDLDDSRNQYVGMDGEYEQWNIDPNVIVEQRWIPCSERLPEAEEKHYWVCTDTGYQCQCRWTNINHFWTELTTEWHWHIMDTPQYSKVIAWMPMPEPWKEGEE